MFDFQSVNTPIKLNRDFILSKISDSMIFGYYFGAFNFTNVYHSRFHKEKTPGTGFYLSSSGKIIYNHFDGSVPKLDAFAFVAKLYNLSFSDTIKRIALDFGLISGNPKPMTDEVKKQLQSFEKAHKKDTKINYYKGKWTTKNTAFWKEHGITREELEGEGVCPIDKLYINDVHIPNKDNNNRYALPVMIKDDCRTKVYSPGGTDTLKFVSNIPNEVPFGLNTVRKDCTTCIVTKSLKDMLILRKFFKSVIAVQNESASFFRNAKNMQKINFYFPDIYINFDIDESGIKAMGEIEHEFGFKPMFLPIPLYKQGITDNGDYVKKFGLASFEKHVIPYFLKENPGLHEALIKPLL